MNRDQIKEILPHREPMLLVDEVEKLSETEAVGLYTVRGDEFFLQGNFPDNPVVPGVIQCEIIAQSACVLFVGKLDGEHRVLPVYAGMNKVKFRRQIKPGDKMILKTRIISQRAPFYIIKGCILVDDKVCMEGEFTVALTKA